MNKFNIKDLYILFFILKIKRDRSSFDCTVWIGCYDCYMHIEDSLLKLWINILKEYKNEKHIVG
jgi:hypothetical protein